MAINHSLHFGGFNHGIEGCHKICYLDNFSSDLLAWNRCGNPIEVFEEFSKGFSAVFRQWWQSGEVRLDRVHTALADLHIFLSHLRLYTCTKGL